MTPRKHRYPFRPLLDAIGGTDKQAMELLRISGRVRTQLLETGLTEIQADRYAVRAGLVPWLIWSDWLDDAQVECASDVCTNLFVPARKGHIYCSKRCTVRHAQRAYRARVKNKDWFMQYGRDYSRRYYAEAGEYVRQRQRAYNQRVKEARDAA